MEPDPIVVPISALQHYEFCPRQCALIHVEGMWDENRLTAEGRILHEKVHDGPDESRGNVRIARGLRLASAKHGLIGIADAVEFVRLDNTSGEGAILPGVAGRWLPYPVEYKRGRPKRNPADRRQLAAQSICLAEMLGVPVHTGALYYGEPRRREEVVFTEDFLEETTALIAKVREMLRSGTLSPPRRGKWCDACSLGEACLPSIFGHSAREYLASSLKDDME